MEDFWSSGTCIVYILFNSLYKSFQALHISLSIISQNLSYLLVVLLTNVLSVALFSRLVYCAEGDIPKSKFISMSMWFFLTTIVPIGYGDIIPESILGKVTATATTIFETLIMTVPLLLLEAYVT